MNFLPIPVPSPKRSRSQTETKPCSLNRGSSPSAISVPLNAHSPDLPKFLLLPPPKPPAAVGPAEDAPATSATVDSAPVELLGVDEALKAAVRVAQEVLPTLGRFSADAESASHDAIFCAYQFLKARDHDPMLHEKRLIEARIKPRKNRSEAVRSLQLILKTAGHATAKSTLHDWANWLTVMDADGVAVTSAAVLRYRTETTFVGGREVKGTARLKARLKTIRSVKSAEARDRKVEVAAEKESEALSQLTQAQLQPVGRIEVETDLDDDGDGLCIWVGRDRSVAGRLDVAEATVIKWIADYGLKR